jgi:hypothetical protein
VNLNNSAHFSFIFILTLLVTEANLACLFANQLGRNVTNPTVLSSHIDMKLIFLNLETDNGVIRS